MAKELYRHICGYPLKKDDEMTRCPGCGGRITPWNTNLADETTATSFGSADAALKHLAGWLVDHHPAIAQDLRDALQKDVAARQEPREEKSQREWLKRLQEYLTERLPAA